MTSSRWVQLVSVLAAIAFVVAGGLLQHPLDAQREPFQLPRASGHFRDLLTIAPGGLRALIVDYLWISSQQLKEEGRFFDAMQRASLICDFQPHFPAVWDSQAWNMAWNISVATHTAEERWLWVTDGIRLLRDRGIPYNPTSIGLYKSISWIFFSKMGGNTDLMHQTYKNRWSKEMQDLLGTPPQGSVEEVVAVFRAVAEAPLDRDPRRQGKEIIQAAKRREILNDPAVAEYAKALQAAGVGIDESLLTAYNRYSRDDAVTLYRGAVQVLDDHDRRMAELLNDQDAAAARARLLAFVRAQLLWNKYRMDPQWMLGLMEKYGPLDWRLVQCHALYWASYGIHVCNSISLKDIDSLTTDRTVLYCLKDLTLKGRLTLTRLPGAPDDVVYTQIADPRFIDVTNREYLIFIEAMTRTGNVAFNRNVLRDGHINYIAECVEALYALGAKEQAGQYWRYIRKAYGLKDVEWASDNVDDFVSWRLRHNEFVVGTALIQIGLSLAAADAALAGGDHDRYNTSHNYAEMVYKIYNEGIANRQPGAPPRSRLPSFGELEREVYRYFLLRPEMFGFQVNLLGRGKLYSLLPDQMRVQIYDSLAESLREQCAEWNVDFDKLFPAPAGLDQYRKDHQNDLLPTESPRP